MTTPSAAPDLLVIGAMRAGTAALQGLLDTHPDIAMSGRSPSAPLRGAASAGWTDPADPGAAARIASTAPDVRLVMLVRDPLERALSHWRHRVREGSEERPAPRALPDPASPYVARSRYHEALAPYRASFDDAQLLVVVLERLRAEPARELARVLRHVGADPARGPEPRRTRVPAPAGPTLDAGTRAAFADAVRDDATALRAWLGDDLPEWA
ncbi:hypothetical protein QE364_001091 [Nocardioides zeae]|uniref:Sulfotransferase n=2 Tax=Nocardioides zeae TaxID=1457234 RepID=A0AAJ1WZS8_9ACTN|nr:sulfotransferase [Nocardioides zeae]MDQ1103928.1 hypothetical protein [Nocardioides zeae]MDR6176378.1 hypothetical protein [Nocardioides zeae]MDR6209391.1 hypothetical protein [Nocardioides zeae]